MEQYETSQERAGGEARMVHEVRGVIARSKGAPVELTAILVPDPVQGEALVARPGLRGVPHRPALPRGGHQRRVPVPPRPRGGRHRGSRRAGRQLRRARRFRRPQLAGGLRAVPLVPPGQAPVLLFHPQRPPEDDPRRRHRARACARHRCFRREDPRGRRAVHQGRLTRPARGRRTSRLRGDGRARGGHVHRRGRLRGLRGCLRLRRGRLRRHRGCQARRSRPGDRRRHRSPQAGARHASSGPPTRSTRPHRTRSRRSGP